ncbi:MAG: glycosyltransferase family 4 protein [Methanobacterium sp.]|nr:glycosyltransferase family 4 protein [Methanobacterium sp.]
MKILNVKVGPPADDYSAWIRIIKIANLMTSLGHEMDFVIYTGLDDFNEEIKKQINFPYEVVKVSPLTIYSKHFKKIKEGNYDLVFCNGQLTHAVLFLTKFKDVTFIMDKHGDVVKEFLLYENGLKFNPSSIFKYLFFKTMDYLNLHFSDRINCVSHKMIEDLYSRGLKPNKAAYVTNGIDLSLFKEPENSKIHEIKDILDINNQMVFTYLGACEKWQGIDKFIEAAEELKDRDELAFVIVGGKKRKDDGNIRYIPKVPQSEVVYYYAISDVLVLPRPTHPAAEVAAPTKFPEYLAMGKPILTTEVGDAAEFVRENQCGIIVKNNDPECLIEGILELKNKDKDVIRKMGINSKKLAKKEFSMEKMASDLSNAFQIEY